MQKIIKKDHPRLYLTSERLNQFNVYRNSDSFFSALVDKLAENAERILKLKPTEFLIIGPRMLKQSQQILHRVATLALAYYILKDGKFIIRARDELFAAAAFPHWNKDHFLDTAELITAFSLGYDWLYHLLPDYELKVIKSALINKGLKAGLEEYKKNVWWLKNEYNWNQVCNGSMLIGALVLADEEPELSSEIFSQAINCLPIAFKTYGIDGAWPAGPEYWKYTTLYSVLIIDALETASGSDYELQNSPGFDSTGLFPVYSSGPFGKHFNFADSDDVLNDLPTLSWLGGKFNIPACIVENHRLLRTAMKQNKEINVFNIIWYQKSPANIQSLPLNKYFRNAEIAYFRSEWNNRDALFIGCKGGNNQADHAHLDIGSFVMDAKGKRWCFDLGRDNYDLPGYWDMSEGGGRWRYFKLNNRSHNTLVLNNDLQRARATANIIDVNVNADKPYAVIDMTRAYIPHASLAKRTIRLQGNNTIIIKDEVKWTSNQRHICWQIITDAEIELNQSYAVLNKEGETLFAKILHPRNADFSVHQIDSTDSEIFRSLRIEYNEKNETSELVVSLGLQQ